MSTGIISVSHLVEAAEEEDKNDVGTIKKTIYAKVDEAIEDKTEDANTI